MRYTQAHGVTHHKLAIASAAVFAVGVIGFAGLQGIAAPGVHAAGGSSIDPATCNNANTMLQWDVTFPDGTNRARTSPLFVINYASDCAVQFNSRIVFVSTPTDPTFVQGYPFTTTSKQLVIKPGVGSLTIKLPEHSVSQITQFTTSGTLYYASSFDTSGRLLPGAVPMATDPADWTQTNGHSL